MPIPATTPIERESVAPKTYSNLWIEQIVIRAPDTQTGIATIECVAYDSETDERHPVREVISTQHLWQAIAEVPAVAQAMGAIIAAAPALRDWEAARAAAEEEGE